MGLALFLAEVLLPSLLYGGVAGVRMANTLFGVQQAHTHGVNTFIVVGIVGAVTALAALFAILGAVAGASVGKLTGLDLEPKD